MHMYQEPIPGNEEMCENIKWSVFKGKALLKLGNNQYVQITANVHTHMRADVEPSDTDIELQRNLSIPYVSAGGQNQPRMGT